MTGSDAGKGGECVLQEIFGSDLCASEGSSVAQEFTVPSPSSTRRATTRRRIYSKNYLLTLRHDRVLPLPENITKPLECPKYDIPTLSPSEPTAFSSLSLPDELLDGLTSLSLTTASAIQSTAIPYARLGGDLVAQATSGTGKTLTYAIVSLDTILPSSPTKTAFVIVPTRELAYQVADIFSKLAKIRVITLVGGTKEYLDVKNLSKPANVIVGTPGRVEVMMKCGAIDVSSIKILVLDEADRLLDGSFGGSVERICNMIPTRQTLAFSATFSYSFRVSLMAVMREPAWIGGSDVVHSVVQQKVECRDLHDKISILEGMLQPTNFGLCLVFFNAKKAAGRLVRTLNQSLPFVSKLVHASMTQKERDAVIREVRQKKVQVLVTTDVLARGIDFDSCDMVIHMDVPQTAETYLHRVGRAGRFGRKGSSTLLFDEAEISAVLSLEEDIGFVIKSPALPDSLSAFMPMKYPSGGAKAVSKRVLPVVQPSEKENRWNDVMSLGKLAESKIKALQNMSDEISPQRYASKHATADDPANYMDVENVKTPRCTIEAVPKSIPQKVAGPSPRINLKQMSQKPFNQRNHVISEARVLKNHTEDMPSANRPKNIPRTAARPKRHMHLEEPATPAKKRKSARILNLSSPNRETGRSTRKQSELNRPSEGPNPGNFPRAKEGENFGLMRSPLENDVIVRESVTRDVSITDRPSKKLSSASNAAATRSVYPGARNPDTRNNDRVGPAKIQADAVTAIVPDPNVPNQQSHNCDETMTDLLAIPVHVRESPDPVTEQYREAWDNYASEAYHEGYREAYEEAFQIAERLRGRLLRGGG